MRLRHFCMAALALVVITGVVDVAGLRAFDELAVVGYLLFYFLAAVALCVLSLWGIRGDTGYARAFDIVGIMLSIGSVLVCTGHFLSAII